MDLINYSYFMDGYKKNQLLNVHFLIHVLAETESPHSEN